MKGCMIWFHKFLTRSRNRYVFSFEYIKYSDGTDNIISTRELLLVSTNKNRL